MEQLLEEGHQQLLVVVGFELEPPMTAFLVGHFNAHEFVHPLRRLREQTRQVRRPYLELPVGGVLDLSVSSVGGVHRTRVASGIRRSHD